MEIVLGVYSTNTWKKLLKKHPHWKSFPFENESEGHVINLVLSTVISCDHVNFIIDDIYFPLDVVNSYSCSELTIILNSFEFLAKTTFWYKCEKISTEKVLTQLEKTKI